MYKYLSNCICFEILSFSSEGKTTKGSISVSFKLIPDPCMLRILGQKIKICQSSKPEVKKKEQKKQSKPKT